VADPTLPAETLAETLAALRAQGGERADPVRFRFLEALARRGQGLDGAARQFLDRRLAAAVADFADRFARVQATAHALLVAAGDRHPDAAEALQQQWAAGDFAALRRQVVALDRAAVASPFAGLAIGGAPASTPAATAADAPEAVAASGTERGPAGDAPVDLKALDYFRDNWAQLSAERQLAQALAAAPENAGPLNSHRLVLCALERMHDVSPAYLRSFLAQIDALLWLAEADNAGGAEKGAAAGDGERKRRSARPAKR